MIRPLVTTAIALPLFAACIGTAYAKSCEELRSLCWTMRSDKSDCTRPHQKCLKTGVFVTPLGRVLKATSR